MELWQLYSEQFLALAFLDADDVLCCPYSSYFGSGLHLALNS